MTAIVKAVRAYAARLMAIEDLLAALPAEG